MKLFLLLLLFGSSQAPDSIIKRPAVVTIGPPSKTLHTDITAEFSNLKIARDKISTNPEVWNTFLGHGGRYDAVQSVCSKIDKIESDHSPHFSIIEYLDNAEKLPPKIQEIAAARTKLKEELALTDFRKNENKVKDLAKEIARLEDDLSSTSKPIRVQQWDKSNQKNYKKNNVEITKLIKQNNELRSKQLTLEASNTIADNDSKIKNIRSKNEYIRDQAEFAITRKPRTKDPLKAAQLIELQNQKANLEVQNAVLYKKLEDFDLYVKGKMAVLSIPYDMHRKFPSTGSVGLDHLKSATPAEAKLEMEKYKNKWEIEMTNAIESKVLRHLPKHIIPASSTKAATYDFEAVWKHNFQDIFEEGKKASAAKKASKHGGVKVQKPKIKSTGLTVEEQRQAVFRNLKNSYAKKFMSTAIYYVKTPTRGYSRLLSLYVDEYKLFLGGTDFDNYKIGLQKWLRTNVEMGWINDADFKSINAKFNLETVPVLDMDKALARNKVGEWIEDIESKLAKKLAPSFALGGVCSSTGDTRRRRRSAQDCIFFTKNKNPSQEVDKIKLLDFDDSGKVVPPNQDEQKSIKPELESEKIKTLDMDAIDSERLTKTLLSDNVDLKTKQTIIDLASKNTDKLVGTTEEIKKAKALLKQKQLEIQASQNEIAKTSLKNPSKVDPSTTSRFQRVRVSMTKFSVKAAKFTKGVGKFSGKYGKIMLAKGVVTALRHGDYLSLGIMGGRIGMELGLGAFKATAKWAGPLGCVADVGLNIWSITKSAKILSDPNASKYDQNDAIADIVVDSIDIAVTGTATILSLMFPPAAPVFAAIAFVINLFATIAVGFFKAENHINRINEQIPLLEYEKAVERGRYVTGSEISGYIQELINTKAANNIVVNVTLQFLRDNSEFIGKVVPSRTLHNPAADCYLQEKVCKKLFHFIPTGCSGWKDVAKCSGLGGYCSDMFSLYSGYRCRADSSDYRVAGEALGLAGEQKEFRCRCGTEPTPSWGYAVSNSVVDFTTKRNVHHLRVSPDYILGSDFEYLCQPSNLEFQGDRISKQSTSWDYLCEGAIGIQRRNGQGKYMLYDLEEGTDVIKLSDSDRTDNVFIVKDGSKDFKGNDGDDTFVIQGPCNRLTGALDGKGFKGVRSEGGGNTLMLGNDCRGMIGVDLKNGRITSSKISVSISNIHKVIGRQNQQEVITADCNVKLIQGLGGNGKYNPDRITLPSCYYLNLQIFSNGSTYIDASTFNNGVVLVVLQKSFNFESKIKQHFPGNLKFKIESYLRLINFVGDNMALTFSDGSEAKFVFEGWSTIVDSSGSCLTPSSESLLTISIVENSLEKELLFNFESKSVQFLHKLGSGAIQRVKGYELYENIFYLQSDHWVVEGGNRNDQFILTNVAFSGTIDGRNGENSLIISNMNQAVEINLQIGKISPNGIGVENVQNIIGRENSKEAVTCSCLTKYLDLKGSGDLITIPENGNCNYDLTIISTGIISIHDYKTKGIVTIQMGYNNDPCQASGASSDFNDLSLKTEGAGGSSMLYLNYPSSSLKSVSKSKISSNAFSITVDGAFPQISLEEGDGLKSALVSMSNEGRVVALHELDSQELTQTLHVRNGAKIIPNVFKVKRGNWNVMGGDLGDMFSLETVTASGSVDGGLGENSLYIGENVPGSVTIFEQGSSSSDGSNLVFHNNNNRIQIRNVQQFHGRFNFRESIYCDCPTRFVSLNGGNENEFDEIKVGKSGSCDWSTTALTVVATGFTKYINFDGKGNFEIYIQPDNEMRIGFHSEIRLNENSSFVIPIKILPHTLRSYQIHIQPNGTIDLRLQIQTVNWIHFSIQYNVPGEKYLPNFNAMFVTDEYESNGNIIVDIEYRQLLILHNLEQQTENVSFLGQRMGAVGAKNHFRVNGGAWECFGGTFDDSFVLQGNRISGKIQGNGGINSLILTESVTSRVVIIDIPHNSLNDSEGIVLEIKGLQNINGRRGMKDKVVCGCDTNLVMTEGGFDSELWDEIVVLESFCNPAITFVVENFTKIQNEATQGNFTYNIKTPNNFELSYKLTNKTRHFLKFEMNNEEISQVKLSNDSLLIVDFIGGEQTSFPISYDDADSFKIEFAKNERLVTDLIFSRDSIESTIVANHSYSGNISGINGAENSIVVDEVEELDWILGGDRDDSIFLLGGVTSIFEIDGGLGINKLKLQDSLYSGKNLEIDLRDDGSITFFQNATEQDENFEDVLIYSLANISILIGRENSFERVTLGCDTKRVMFADLIQIEKAACEYDVAIQIGLTTRVQFLLEKETENLEENLEDDSTTVDVIDVEATTFESITSTSDEVFDNSVDRDPKNFPNHNQDADEELAPVLSNSKFMYHFSIVKSFDIETENVDSISNTRHVFFFNFTLQDLSSLHFSVADSRLIYKILNSELEYSHKMFGIDFTEMFYSQPEFMTSDGFQIGVNRHGEILISFGNPQESLPLDEIQNRVVPILSSIADQLSVSFLIETKQDFIYCGNEKENNVLSNRASLTSHLSSFNQSTYVILSLDKDVYIYPQNVSNNPSSLHVIDMCDVIYQIRNETGRKYLPEVLEDGENLKIVLTGYEHIYPGIVHLVNGTQFSGAFRVLLNSIAMEFIQLTPESINERVKRDVNTNATTLRGKWGLRPRDIEIPQGHVYLLAAEDLEDGVLVKPKVASNKSGEYLYGRDNNDLVVTNLGGNENGITFVIYDYYKPPSSTNQLKDFNDTTAANASFSSQPPGPTYTVNNLVLDFGNGSSGLVNSGVPIIERETGGNVEIGFYEDILDEKEYEILKEFPEIKRLYKVSLSKKIMRTVAYRNSAYLCIFILVLISGYLVWAFCKKKEVHGKYEIVKAAEVAVAKNSEIANVDDNEGEKIELLGLSEIIPEDNEAKLVIARIKYLPTPTPTPFSYENSVDSTTPR